MSNLLDMVMTTVVFAVEKTRRQLVLLGGLSPDAPAPVDAPRGSRQPALVNEKEDGMDRPLSSV